jgi:hypothetical protein
VKKEWQWGHLADISGILDCHPLAIVLHTFSLTFELGLHSLSSPSWPQSKGLWVPGTKGKDQREIVGPRSSARETWRVPDPRTPLGGKCWVLRLLQRGCPAGVGCEALGQDGHGLL